MATALAPTVLEIENVAADLAFEQLHSVQVLGRPASENPSHEEVPVTEQVA